jgi:hypothetical protein
LGGFLAHLEDFHAAQGSLPLCCSAANLALTLSDFQASSIISSVLQAQHAAVAVRFAIFAWWGRRFTSGRDGRPGGAKAPIRFEPLSPSVAAVPARPSRRRDPVGGAIAISAKGGMR